MSNRDTTWKILQDCLNDYSDDVRDELEAIKLERDKVLDFRPKHHNGNVRAPDLTEVNKKAENFWKRNSKLREDMAHLLSFMLEKFAFDVNTVDQQALIEETHNLIRGSDHKTFEEAKAYEVSDEVFPILVIRFAMRQFRVPFVEVQTDDWRKFAKFYSRIMIAA